MTKPRRLNYDYSEGYAKPIYATGLVEQPWENYTPSEHQIWQTLFERQEKVLQKRASPLYLKGRAQLDLNPYQIPKFEDINQKLRPITGWQIKGVEGLLPGQVFFQLLSQRIFPVTWWIRGAEQLDYLPEPDLFHDIYGHVPLLTDPDFAEFILLYSKAAQQIQGNLEMEEQLNRLYWYTVEFGLMGSPQKPVISGAGILSSKTESEYATDSPQAERRPFDLQEVLHRPYRIDVFQDCYFVIDNFQTLIQIMKDYLEKLN